MVAASPIIAKILTLISEGKTTAEAIRLTKIITYGNPRTDYGALMFTIIPDNPA